MAEKRAAGVILYRRGADGRPRFLLLNTRDGGHWSPPKGHLDRGETDEEAALRETREESGLAPAALDPAFRVEIQYDAEKKGRIYHKVVNYFLGEAAPGDVELSHEHTDARWATIEEARQMIRFDTLRGVLEKAAEWLSSTTS